jgi:hypothetical protein
MKVLLLCAAFALLAHESVAEQISAQAKPYPNGIRWRGRQGVPQPMSNPVNVYFIWYGDKWLGKPALKILPGLFRVVVQYLCCGSIKGCGVFIIGALHADFINSLSGSPIQKIMTTYTVDGTRCGKKLSDKVFFKKAVSDDSDSL